MLRTLSEILNHNQATVFFVWILLLECVYFLAICITEAWGCYLRYHCSFIKCFRKMLFLVLFILELCYLSIIARPILCILVYVSFGIFDISICSKKLSLSVICFCKNVEDLMGVFYNSFWWNFFSVFQKKSPTNSVAFCLLLL